MSRTSSRATRRVRPMDLMATASTVMVDRLERTFGVDLLKQTTFMAVDLLERTLKAELLGPPLMVDQTTETTFLVVVDPLARTFKVKLLDPTDLAAPLTEITFLVEDLLERTSKVDPLDPEVLAVLFTETLLTAVTILRIRRPIRRRCDEEFTRRQETPVAGGISQCCRNLSSYRSIAVIDPS